MAWITLCAAVIWRAVYPINIIGWSVTDARRVPSQYDGWRVVPSRVDPGNSVQPCRADAAYVPQSVGAATPAEANRSYVTWNARHFSHFQPGTVRYNGGAQARGGCHPWRRWEGFQDPGEALHARISGTDGKQDGAASEGIWVPAAQEGQRGGRIRASGQVRAFPQPVVRAPSGRDRQLHLRRGMLADTSHSLFAVARGHLIHTADSGQFAARPPAATVSVVAMVWVLRQHS